MFGQLEQLGTPRRGAHQLCHASRRLQRAGDAFVCEARDSKQTRPGTLLFCFHLHEAILGDIHVAGTSASDQESGLFGS